MIYEIDSLRFVNHPTYSAVGQKEKGRIFDRWRFQCYLSLGHIIVMFMTTFVRLIKIDVHTNRESGAE